MPELLRQALAAQAPGGVLDVLGRLLAAAAFGALVAVTYRRTRPDTPPGSTFTTTLVLLAILIAMVTQVVGDNVARAFSLVGALSIVRFRTVVRDTQDTAYVIFAVGVGMAAGAGNHLVAMAGIAVAAAAAVVMKPRSPEAPAGALSDDGIFELQVRVGIGHDPQRLFGAVLSRHAADCQLVGVATARQGAALDVTYRVRLREETAADQLVAALNRLDGIQGVTLSRLRLDEEPAMWRTS